MCIRDSDKAAECKNDPVKQAMLIERRWGKFTTKAIRVEFQLRNKALKKFFNVRTVADLFAALGTIAKWCTHEWFRIVEQFDRKNRNHARSEVTQLWRRVQEQFESWTGAAPARTPAPRRLAPNLDLLKQQAIGCVASISAHLDDGKDFLTQWKAIGVEALRHAEAKVAAKRTKLAAASRVFAAPDFHVPF